MKNILFLLLAFSAQTAFAQLIFSTAPKVGEEYHTVSLELTGVNKNELKKEGADKTWIFGNGSIAKKQTIVYKDPKQTPYSALYSNANLAYEILPNLDSVYFYQIADASGVYDLGVAEPLYNSKWYSPFQKMKFPLKFGEAFEDTTTADITNIVTINVTGDQYSIVDGWGTVQTPAGTYPCLRLVSRTLVEGFLSGIPVASRTQETYLWYNPQYGYPVAIFDAIEDDENGKLSNDTTVAYLETKLTSTLDLSNASIKIMSNPIQDEINFELGSELQGKLNISLISQDGKVVYESVKTVDSKRLSIDATGFNPGAYLLMVQAENRKWAIEKVIIE